MLLRADYVDGLVSSRAPRYEADVAIPTSSHSYLLFKRAIDVALCIMIAPVLLPVMVLCAIAIRIDSPGPIVFRQERTGRHGLRFGMFKFRTMVRNAEELKKDLAHLNILPPPDFKIPNDPRITTVGRFLRKTSLDELPQIVNVLRGEMSLVGPRPTSFSSTTYSLWHTERLEVTPGITGLWQVRGRNVTTFDERLRLDIEYVRSMSLVLDLKILLWTFRSVVSRSGV
jgi:lipopolysaccharide/colanic/teichoic acid biosynthesis glycosyltransferase